MNRNIKLLMIVLLTMSAIACRTVDPTPIPVPPTVTPPSPGTASFAKYVAIGNSLTAGFANGGLYRDGQLVAYPNLLAQQFARVGGGAFVQPLFTTAKKDGSGYLRLINIPLTGLPNLQPYAPAGSIAVIGLGADGTTPLYEKFTGANQNLGVPGIRMSDVTTSGYGLNNPAGFNPYFERLLNSGSATTYLEYVTAQSAGATFFTIWMGNNDALGYAVSGGLVPFTPDGAFTANLQALLAEMPATAKGLIAAIPQVTKAAFFRTITEPLILSQVNAGLPAGVPPLTDLYIQTGAGTPKAMGANDFLLIGSQTHYSNIGRTDFGAGAPFPYGLHPNNPIISQHVLDEDEVTAVTNQINAYNAILQAEATAKNLAFYDPNIVLTQAESASGFVTNGLKFTTAFITGGLVSLDGIHLTPAGNAVIANEMIKVINTKYGATIPLLNVANYKTLEVVYQ